MKRFGNYFSTKLSRYFSTITVIITLVAATFLYFAIGYIDQQVVKNDLADWTQVLQNDFKRIEEAKNALNVFERTHNIQRFNEEMYRIRQQSQIKFNFILLEDGYEIISTDLFPLNQNQFLKGRNLSELRYQTDKPIIIDQNYNSYLDGQQAASFIALNGQKYSLVIEHLNESMTDISELHPSILYVYDRYRYLIFHESLKYRDDLGKFNPIDDVVLATYTIQFFNQKLYVSAIMDNSSRQQVLINSVLTIVMLMLAILLLIPKFVKQLMKPLNLPINHLLNVIKNNQAGKFEVVEVKQDIVEFDEIIKSFNALMHNLEQTLQSNQELLERKRFMEIKQMQDQFNPHFLFNALESIRYEVRFNPENGAEMIAALARLMRYMITVSQSEATIEEDINYLMDYLNLQGMRYQHRLDFHVSIENTIKQVVIPKFILQPLVENSIKHNMEQVEHLTIGVIGRKIDEYIQFDVVDDGIGINHEELERIKLTLATGTGKSFGLYNVHRTIQLMYGEQYGVFIDNIGKGLHVKIKIPTGGNHENNHS